MKNKAFTLIELLVVIVIIGILATISTATFSGSSKKARDAKIISALSASYLGAEAASEIAENQDYSGFCNRTNVQDRLNAAGDETACLDIEDYWSVLAPLEASYSGITTPYHCVGSDGGGIIDSDEDEIIACQLILAAEGVGGGSALGGSCTDISDCAEGYCLANVCTAFTDLGDACSQQSDCQGFCDTFNGGCTDGSINETCGEADECRSNVCSQSSYVCVAGLLGDSCTWGDECLSGICVDNICNDGFDLPNGEFCPSAANCLSGYCSYTDNVCISGVSGIDCYVDDDCISTCNLDTYSCN